MKTTIPFLMLLMMISCATPVRLTVDKDLDFAFGNVERYSWRPVISEAPKEIGYDPCVIEKRIHLAMDPAMQKKGYTVSTASTRLQLHYHIIVEDKKVDPTEVCDYETNTYWIRALTDPNDYEAGTLIVDMVDVAGGCVVWRGRAVAVLDDEHSTDLQHELNRAMEHMLKTLPPSKHAPAHHVKKQALFAQQ